MFHMHLGGHGHPLQCSCLETPTDRGAWRAAARGVTQHAARSSPSLSPEEESRASLLWVAAAGAQQSNPGPSFSAGSTATRLLAEDLRKKK